MLWVGTSGFQYPEWHGKFYPQDLPASGMLAFYAQQFASVEINYTFRRFPSEDTLKSWRDETPERFKFALKAPARITEIKRLRGAIGDTRAFFTRVQLLGSKLGVIDFKLPENFAPDLPLLNDFLDGLPLEIQAAFEFRHPGWHTDAMFTCLQEHHVALCVSDTESVHTPAVRTADYAYLRLRDEQYESSDISHWANLVCDWQTTTTDIFVYFKHEATGKGPEFAREFLLQVSEVCA